MGVALQDLHCVAVGDVIKADPIGCQDLITHFYAVLLCKTTRVQPEETDGENEKKPTESVITVSTINLIWYGSLNLECK